MKKIKRITMIIMIMFLMILVTGCSSSEEVSYQRGVVAFSGPYGTEMYNNSKEPGTCATTEKANYHFSVDLSQKQISEYVEQTERIIAEMESFGEVSDRKYEIYVTNVDYITAVEENTLYTTYLDFGKLEHIQGLAQLIFGNETNYGLLYGYAASLGKEYGFDVVTDGLTEALKLRETNPEYLDLNYACFMLHYVDEEDIERLKIIAANYYKYLEEHGKTDVVKDYSDEKHREYFNEFLTANGVETYDNSDMDGIAVYSGGNAVRLIWENQYSKFYIEKDFQPNRIEECFGEDMLNSGYHNLRKIMVDYKYQAEWVVKELSAYDFEMYQGKVVFTSHSEEYKQMLGGICRWEWGSKTPEDGTIEIYIYQSYAHEYVHLLTGPSRVDAWLVEALAYYYTFLERDMQLNYKLADEKAAYDNGLLDSTKQILEAHMGRPLDLQEDWLFYLNACNVMYDKFDRVTADVGGGSAKFLFVTYLIELTGEEDTIKALISGDAEGTFGKSWEELQIDWKEKCLEEYSWVVSE